MGINDRDTVMLMVNLWLTFYVMKYLDFDKQKIKIYNLYRFIFSFRFRCKICFLATEFPYFFMGFL